MPTLKFKENSRPMWILFAVCILAVMVQVDYTAVNVAIVDISKSLHASLTIIQWVLSAYVLTWASFVLAAGRIADIFGRRRMFIIGTVFFLLGSMFSGMATSDWMLIISRMLQGLGGALFIPSLYSLVFTAFPEHKQGMALGVLSGAFALGMAIGPTLGGVILHLLDWRWIFYVNVPLGLLVLFIITKVTPKEPKRVLDEPMDYMGMMLLAVASMSLIYALSLLSSVSIISINFLSLVAVAAVFLIAFIFIQLRRKYPLIRLSLFKNKPFLGCVLVYVTMGYNFAAVLIIIDLYIQNTLNYSAFDTGFVFLVMTIAFGILSYFGGKFADSMDARIPITVGAAGTAVAVLIFAFTTLHTPVWMTMIGLAFAGLGLGLAFPALNTAMMRTVDQNELSTASGAFTMFGCYGNTIGLIFSSIILVAIGKLKLFSLFATKHLHLTTVQNHEVSKLMASTHYSATQLTSFPKAMIPNIMHDTHTAFVHAMSQCMKISFVLAVIGVVLTIILIKVPKPDFSMPQENIDDAVEA